VRRAGDVRPIWNYPRGAQQITRPIAAVRRGVGSRIRPEVVIQVHAIRSAHHLTTTTHRGGLITTATPRDLRRARTTAGKPPGHRNPLLDCPSSNERPTGEVGGIYGTNPTQFDMATPMARPGTCTRGFRSSAMSATSRSRADVRVAATTRGSVSGVRRTSYPIEDENGDGITRTGWRRHRSSAVDDEKFGQRLADSCLKAGAGTHDLRNTTSRETWRITSCPGISHPRRTTAQQHRQDRGRESCRTRRPCVELGRVMRASRSAQRCQRRATTGPRGIHHLPVFALGWPTHQRSRCISPGSVLDARGRRGCAATFRGPRGRHRLGAHRHRWRCCALIQRRNVGLSRIASALREAVGRRLREGAAPSTTGQAPPADPG